MNNEESNIQNVKIDEDLNEMLKIRREKLQKLQDMGKDPFKVEKYDQSHHSNEIKENFEGFEGQSVSIAGRIMSKRIQGK
ncbi:MAG TPA: lysine--tRNA ligase, partial [Peptostreptococcaceae bacterium]|nr:lysine--tRNA ligase [Peptostreptococcaceae bacterium]